MNRTQAMTLVSGALVMVIILIAGFGVWKLFLSRHLQSADPASQTLTPASPPPFADYHLEITPFTASLPDTQVAVNELSNLSNFERKDRPFSATEKTYLGTNAFVITPNLDKFYSDNPDDPTMRSDDWTGLYQEIGGYSIFSRAPENSVFITTDYLLHVYHRLVSKEIEYIEQSVFLPKLTELSEALFKLAVTKRDATNDPTEKASYDRLTTYFAVPAVILQTVSADVNNQIVGDSVNDNITTAEANLDKLKPQLSQAAYDRAVAELKLIFDHQQVTAPPLFEEPNRAENLNITEDYTQYTPRGHYAKNAMLRAYFRAMMWYGRTNFLVKSDALTRDALHITQFMDSPTSQTLWSNIYTPTAFLVGESDDLSWKQYQEVLQKAAISDSSITQRQLQNAQLLIGLLPKPQIMSSVIIGEEVLGQTKEELQDTTQGFRFFGQRFTPDAFIFTTLTQGQEKPDPETGESLPSNTTGLLVMSALGNTTADQFIPEWILTNAPESQHVLGQKLAMLKEQFSKLDQAQWNQNMYWSWLFTLQSVFTDYQTVSGYPSFMRSPYWKVKNLQASLGSWTELKHDTLLYSKQSYAELGAGGEDPPPVPKGYVEPNIPFYDRLLALSKYTQAGLKNSDALPQEFAGRHQQFDESVTFFRDIAVKQLANEVISDDDFETLRSEGGQLDSVIRPLPNEQSIEANARSALIADVHTDAVQGQILYEATGIPDYIYVAVKDTNGTRLTKGLVFSHYEFTGPLDSRETDQTWQEKNYPPNQLPSRPFWVRDLISQ